MYVDLKLEKAIQSCKDPIKLSKIGLAEPGAERVLAKHPIADALLLRRLAGHGDKYVRLEVAKHANADEKTLKELARDREVIIREAARLNLILRA